MAKKIPSKTKFLKIHSNFSTTRFKDKLNSLNFGIFGIQSLESKFISSNSLEAARVAINHCLKRRGKLWCRVFPQYAITRKAAETRMGKGKGDVAHYATFVRIGTIIFEVSGVNIMIAKHAFSLGDRKLPVKCKFIYYRYNSNI